MYTTVCCCGVLRFRGMLLCIAVTDYSGTCTEPGTVKLKVQGHPVIASTTVAKTSELDGSKK